MLHKHLNKYVGNNEINISQALNFRKQKGLFIPSWFIQDYLKVLQCKTDGKTHLFIQILHKTSVNL